MTRLALPALAALASGLAAVLVLESTAEPPGDAPPAAIAIPALRERPDIRPDRAAAVATALARPLFDPDRRPHAPDGSAAQPGLPRLAGVLVAGEQRVALLVLPGSEATLALREGGHAGNFTVTRIAAGAVTLTGPDGPVVMRPVFGRSTLAPPASAAPQAPGAPADGPVEYPAIPTQ